MSWFNNRDKDVPDRFKGKTEAEILAALEESDKKIEAGKQALELAKEKEAALATKETELTQTRNRVAELEGNLRARPNNQPLPDNTPKGPQSVLIDEEGAFRDRLTPLFATQLQTQAQLAVMTVKEQIRSDPKRNFILKKYQKEVDEKFATIHLTQQIYPASYLNCINVVLAEHVDEIMDAKAKGEGDFAIEPGGGGTPPAAPASRDKLTDEELATAKRMGVKPEDYLARRKTMQFVGA